MLKALFGRCSQEGFLKFALKLHRVPKATTSFSGSVSPDYFCIHKNVFH